MLRRLTAVLILHFLLCVGLSAAGLNTEVFVPQGPEVSAQNALDAPQSPATPGAFSDADDHALMDDKDDLPDPLEPHPVASAGTAHSMAAVPHRVIQAVSALVAPPHKPPKASGVFA